MKKVWNFALIALSIFAVSAPMFAQGNKESSVKDQGPTTIKMMDSYAAEDPHGKFVYAYAEKFMKDNPDIKIEIQAVASNDIYTKLAAMATSPQELPTLYWTSADQIPTLYDLGLTEDLNKYFTSEDKNKLANGVVDATLNNGEMMYCPVSLQPTCVIYRIDRFEEAGLEVPKTWEDFIECAKALTEDTNLDGQTNQWGFSMVGSNNSSGQSRFMSYLWSNGYDCAKLENGKWVTDIKDDKQFLDIFKAWTDMNTNKVVPLGITEVNYSTAANYFAMGYTSMFLSGPNALGVAYFNNPDLKGKLGSFIMPGDSAGTMLGAEGYAISKYATEKEKQAAAKLIKYFAENDSEYGFWKSSGKIPATKDGQQVDFVSGTDYEGFLNQINAGCRPTLVFPGIAGLKSALGKAYSAVFSGEKTNEEAIKSLVSDLKELMEDYN
jgi:multiple sugar transport system substrate-binding protein